MAMLRQSITVSRKRNASACRETLYTSRTSPLSRCLARISVTWFRSKDFAEKLLCDIRMIFELVSKIKEPMEIFTDVFFTGSKLI